MSLHVEYDTVRVEGRVVPGGPLTVKRGSTLVIEGWACDPERRLAPAIVARIDGSIEVHAKRVVRPDVATHFHDDALSGAGFVLELPTELSLGDHVISIGSFENDVFLNGASEIGLACVAADSDDVRRYLGPYETRLLSSLTNHDFMLESRFIAAMQSVDADPLVQQHGRHGDWSFHVVLFCAELAMRLPGDIVQCGVFNGSDAAAMTTYLDFGKHPEKTLYLLDTFTGVPEEQWTPDERKSGADSAQWMYHQSGDLHQSVLERFREFPNVRIIQGRVPESLTQVDSRQISALFLDMNVAFAERAALRILWDRIVPGGLVFSDDYGHTSGPGSGFWEQKVVLDEFAASVGLPVLSLPTGQGLLIKV